MALQSGGPVATGVIRTDGGVRLGWMSDAMAELLGRPRGEHRLARLADTLTDDSGDRLAATVTELVRTDGRSASLQVSLATRPHEHIWFHLLLEPSRFRSRLLTAARVGRRQVAVHVQTTSSAAAVPSVGFSPGRAELDQVLTRAVMRLRRRPSRIAVALVSTRRYGSQGLRSTPLSDTLDLAERVRRAARETDVVITLDAGRLAVLAEDVNEGGEIAMARRVLAVLHQPTGDQRPVVSIAVLEITDPSADPDAVIDRLLSAEAPVAPSGELTVLRPWDGGGSPAPSGGGDTARTAARLRGALESGRFVVGERRIGPLDGQDGPAPPLTFVETCTSDAGVLTPVRVDAPGLVRELDRWLLRQVTAGPVPDDRPGSLVLRLQPGADLSLDEDDVATLGRSAVLQVPEERLLDAFSANRAVLRTLVSAGVALGVAGWSGRIDVPTLVRWGVRLVELSPATSLAVLTPEGAGLLAGLAAGLRAGLGDDVVVVAEDPQDRTVAKTLGVCGVSWAIPPRASIMGEP